MAFVSPGVYVRELDYSDYVPALSSTILGMIGGATKGPVNEPTIITNENDLIRTFGPPVLNDYGLLSAIQFLRQGRQLLYLRVANGDATADAKVNDSSDTLVMTFEANSPGTWANGLRVLVADGSESGKYDVSIQTYLDRSATSLATVEYFRDVQIDDPTGDDYIEDVINDGIYGVSYPSQYITVDVDDGSLTPVTGTYQLGVGAGNTVGDDGIDSLSEADYIGIYTGQTATGLKAFADAEKIDVSILTIPGVSAPSVINDLILTCETRGDCMAVVDAPFGLDVQNVIDWHNGTGAYSHQAFNSSYAALYWPWVRILDNYNRKEIWMPPSGFVTAQYAYTDYTTYPWFAPAGFTRGRVKSGIRIEMSPDLGQRDFLYGNGNAVNPIVNFTREGLTIWGQRTLQRRPTALDRVNVRRMLLAAEKAIATAVKYLVFEPNDPVTWRRFVNLVSPAMDYIKANRGVYEFKVVCDETTNPPIVIDRNEMNGRILLKPTKAAEMIVVDFVLLSTGANFEEFVNV